MPHARASKGRMVGMPGSARVYGRRTILDRHTSAHRVDELLAIDRQLRGAPPANARTGIPMGVGML